MRHQLILLRHAKATLDRPSIPDRDRALRKRGRRAASMMRLCLREADLVPDLVLVSPSRRTMETMEGLRPWGRPPIVDAQERLYLADTRTLLDVLQAVDEDIGCVLLIGHNPGLEELVELLAAPSEAELPGKSFPTCAMAAFSLAGPWSGIGTETARLTHFVTPRDLKETD